MAKYNVEMRRGELEILLNGNWEYTDPPSCLNGLGAEDACRPVTGCPHTIAELVLHMHYWQQELLEFARGNDPKRGSDFKFGVTDFGEVKPDDWEKLRAAFLASYEDLLKCAEDPELMRREPNDTSNIGFMLANHALHNAYHLGQVVLMRIQQGNWVPAHPEG